MAKEPEPGRVKTRLCPPLRPEEASALYGAFLDDLAARLARERPPVTLRVAVHPAGAVGRMAARFADAGAACFAQEGEDLPARMEAAFRHAFAAGHRRVVLSNTDSPHLSYTRHVRPALEALGDRSTDAVFGPDLSGGYYLVGLRREAPGLFGAPVSTRDDLERTVGRAVARGLSVDLLSPTLDIDRFADLGELARQVDDGGIPAAELPRTLARVRELLARYGGAAGAG